MYSDLEFLNFTTAVNSTFFFSHAVYGNEGTKCEVDGFVVSLKKGRKTNLAKSDS